MNSSSIVRHLAIKGQGIAILREYLVREQLNDGTLVRVLGDYAIDERKLYVVYQKDRYRPMRTRIFVTHLFAWLKQFSGDKRGNGRAEPPVTQFAVDQT